MDLKALKKIFDDNDFVHTSGTPEELKVAEPVKKEESKTAEPVKQEAAKTGIPNFRREVVVVKTVENTGKKQEKAAEPVKKEEPKAAEPVKQEETTLYSRMPDREFPG